MIRLALLLLIAAPAAAETLVAARTIRSQSVIGPGDVLLVAGEVPGALGSLEPALGMEAKVMLYEGRPIRPQDLAPPALVERNQLVPLIFARAGLSIATDGRALDRASVGQRVRVMNLSSKTTVSGVVLASGEVLVGGEAAR